MVAVEQLLNDISGIIWGWPLIILLFGTHIFLTIRLRFIQRYIGTAIKLSFSRKSEGAGEISHFGALMTALAATIGTGNIVGVATAVALGGPGAVLWMWLTGIFGISTKYGEAVLAIKYREIDKDGVASGGPMYALKHGLKSKWLAILFAAFTAIAAFGIGNMVQANSISELMKETFGAPGWVTGIILTAATALVILGGVQSIAKVCEMLVPIMVVIYVLGCMVLLAIGWQTIPDTVWLIITSAFGGQAALGGFAGSAMKETVRYGIARGLFSNEAGLGSAPIVAAAAMTKNPVRQALVSSTGTFWDTVVVCLVTGVVIVNSGRWTEGLNGSTLTHAAFSQLGYFGPMLLTFGLLTFVFSTILGWSYYGEKAVEYLLGRRAVTPYRWLWVGAVMVGSTVSLSAVWSFADIANGLMAVPNLIALLLLNGVIVAETKKYLWTKDSLDNE